MEEKTEVKAHYHMIAAEITWREKDAEQFAIQRINGVLVDQSRDIPARLLGKAQQIVQVQFHNRMQLANVEVLDVVIINLMYLGEFTQSEFQKAPEGTKLQERPAPVADLETVVSQAGPVAANEDRTDHEGS